MGTKHKRPSLLTQPHPQKIASSKEQPDWWSFNIAWRISRMEMCDPFGWHELDAQMLHYIREKLSNFESMTLNEIFVKHRKQNHGVPIKGLRREAIRRLADLRLDDIDELYTLHLSGKERIWGILNHNVLTLLWWDPTHQACPSEKKHT